MANAKQCDRCDKFYKPYDGLPILTNQDKTEAGFMYNKIILKTRNTNIDKIMDLCPECMCKLIDFLFYEDNNDKNEVNEEDEDFGALDTMYSEDELSHIR